MEIILLLSVFLLPVAHRGQNKGSISLFCWRHQTPSCNFLPICFTLCESTWSAWVWHVATGCPAARSVTIRLQWLVEHGGVNLSPLAEAMNHFSSQLCNLSPTSPHKTASLRCAFAHLRLSRLMLFTSCSEPYLNSPSHVRVHDNSFHTQEYDRGSITQIRDCLAHSLSNRI